MAHDLKLGVSRQSVRRLLAGRPRRHQLRARYLALERLHDDVARFVGWEALCQSLQQDMAAILGRQ